MLRSSPGSTFMAPGVRPAPVGPRAMTAALVIVPTPSARARTASAHGRPGPRDAGGTRAGCGAFPWMVRLFTGRGGLVATVQCPLTAAHRVGSTGHDLP
jgi:hypothetical protein